MRDAARCQLGFFPAPTEAIDLLLSRLSCHPEGSAVIDPCAGAGAALKQIVDRLGIQHRQTYAIELEKARGEQIREAMPEATVLSPASLFGCSISSRTMGLVYCNPPFDDQAGEKGRVEFTWLQRCTGLLASRGILVFVCPEPTMEMRNFRMWVAETCQQITVLPFPAKVRKHKEVFVLAIRRRDDIEAATNTFRMNEANAGYQYIIPSAPGPSRFIKTALTDAELDELIEASPLRSHLNVPPLTELPRPPLALACGHLALLLATGHLDGVVCPADGIRHVIRGTARKTEEETEREETKTKTEKIVKSTLTERIVLSIRAIDADGVMHELT